MIPSVKACFYETERALAEYLLFHYGSPEQILPWTFGPATALDYPARCVSECLQIARLAEQEEADALAQFGDEYRRYQATSGMFWPRIRT